MTHLTPDGRPAAALESRVRALHRRIARRCLK
jgi:hypothetical protein